MGQIAFDAYFESMLGKTHDGKPIPSWEDLGDQVRAGWEAAGQAITDFALQYES